MGALKLCTVLTYLMLVRIARIPLPLHLTLAQDSKRVPVGQQGVGTPKVCHIPFVDSSTFPDAILGTVGKKSPPGVMYLFNVAGIYYHRPLCTSLKLPPFYDAGFIRCKCDGMNQILLFV